MRFIQKNLGLKLYKFLLIFKKYIYIENIRIFIFIFKITGFFPKKISLYKEALTHPSFNKRNLKMHINYERLEFLGDSILGKIVAEYLFRILPDKKEGYLTIMRSKIVNRKKLNFIGKKLNLNKYIFHDKNSLIGENTPGNVYEALVAAVFLDYGIKKCKKFVNNTLLNLNSVENLEKETTSYKNLLLEYSQKKKKILSFNTYEVSNKSGNNLYITIVSYNNKIIKKGKGTSKKKSEEIAAKNSYYSLINN